MAIAPQMLKPPHRRSRALLATYIQSFLSEAQQSLHDRYPFTQERLDYREAFALIDRRPFSLKNDHEFLNHPLHKKYLRALKYYVAQNAASRLYLEAQERAISTGNESEINALKLDIRLGKIHDCFNPRFYCGPPTVPINPRVVERPEGEESWDVFVAAESDDEDRESTPTTEPAQPDVIVPPVIKADVSTGVFDYSAWRYSVPIASVAWKEPTPNVVSAFDPVKVRLSQALAELLREIEATGKEISFRKDIRLLIEFAMTEFNDPFVSDWTDAEIRTFEKMLTEIPTRKGIPASHMRTLSPRYRYAKVFGWSNLTPLSEKRIQDGYHITLHRFFDWLISKGYFFSPQACLQIYSRNEHGFLRAQCVQ